MMSGWGQYPDSSYGRQQGGSQQTYGAPAQQQVNAYAGYGATQGAGYTDSQGAGGAQASGYGQSGFGQSGYSQSQPSSGAMQSGYGSQQQAGYGYGQQSGQGGAVAQAAQGLPPDQQARVSQMMAQMGGSGGQQAYGSASYQGATHPSAAASYNAGSSQSAYGTAQPAAQTYPQGQIGTYAAQQSPSTMQQGYGNTVQMSQQGYNSSAFGASQQGSTGYAQQQQQQPPSAYSTQAGYQAPQQANSASTYVAQQPGQAYGQVPAASQAFSAQATHAPHAAQPTAYSQQAAHGLQQTGGPQQSVYDQQATARPYQAPYAQQYGANQYSSQQAPAAAQTPAAPMARPQQLPAPGTYSKASYNRPVTQARPAAATPAATSASGRPTVQAPAGIRNAISGRPVVIPPASSKQAAATAPAGRQGAAATKASANPRSANAASNARGTRAPAVGQSAREIARLADSMRDNRDDSRVRERGLDADKERAKERPTAVPVRVTPSRERERERDREPARLKRHGPAPKSPPPLRRREPDYAVKLSTRPVTALERDYNDVIDRYPRLYVSADFAKIVSAWVQAEAFPEEKPLWPLHKPVSFQHEMDFELAEAPVTSSQAPATPSQAVGVKWNARVMLLQGLTDAAAKEWKKGTHHAGQHLHQLLKFLTVRHEVDNAVKGRMERSGIMAVGGAYDAALDGPMDGDPRTSKALINTCIRHARDKLSIDLRPCLQWLCFLEIHYQRPAASLKPPAMETSEVTIIFMADVSTVFDKDWTSAWEAQQAWLKQKEEHDAAEAKKAKEAEETKAEELKEAKAAEAAKAAEVETAKVEPASAAAEKQDSKAEEGPEPLPDAPTAVAEPGKAESQKTVEDRAAKAGENGGAVPTKDAGKPNDAASEPGATDSKTTGKAAKEADAVERDGAMPDVPRLLIRGKRFATDRWRSASVSLDGLLDYDEEDRDEHTLDLSLFAEAFQEMLARHFGTRILKALYMERDAALHRREDRKRKRDEEKAAEKEKEEEKENVKKIKEDTQKEAEGAAKEEPAAQQNGTRGSEAKDDTPGQAQVKTEHIKEKPASAAASEAGVIPNGNKAGDKEGKGAKKLDEDTVNGVGKEPKPVDSMPNSTVEKEGARTGEVLAGKPAVCEEASKMEVDTAAVAAQAINNSAADTAMEVDAAPKAGAAGKPTAETAGGEGKEPEGSDKVAVAVTAEGAAKGGKQGDTTEEKTEKEDEKPKEKPKKKYKVDEELLQAFRYFDRNCTGYLRVDDLRRIINNLGLSLSLRTVKELCLNVAGGSSSSRTRADRVYYRDVTDKEVL